MNNAPYSAQCECGATLPVTASAAGTTIACRCGRAVRVPRLSELRVAKGLGALETNVRDTISRMVREGSLPWGQCCADTGMPTGDVMLLDVECERSYVKGRSSKRWGTVLMVFAFFISWPLAIFMWLAGRDLYTEPVEHVGRDVTITVPLRIKREAQGRVKRYSQSRLKVLLASVPIYERLMTDYPDARIYPR